MSELGGIWAFTASIQASIVFGVLIMIVLWRKTAANKSLPVARAQRAAMLLALSISFYTFFVLIVSQLIVGGPSIATLVEKGIGNDRIAWLILAVSAEQGWRLVELFRSS